MIKENTLLTIFGLGHMELPTAALLAQIGLRVVGVDINQQTVENVNSGISPIMEPGLDEIVREKSSRIKNRLLICTRSFLNPKDFHNGGVTFKGVGLS